MAGLSATTWNDFQDQNASDDKRYTDHGIVNLVKNSTPFTDYISPAAQEKFATFNNLRNVKIPIIIDGEVEVVTTPGFNFIPDNLSESVEYSFTAVDIFSGFRHYPSTYDNNTIDENFDKNVKMKRVANGIADKMEEILTTTLEARKTQKLDFLTQLNQGSGGGIYTFTGGNILEINRAAQRETMFSSLDEVMTANKLKGNYSLVTSPAALSVQKLEALKFGEGNEKNIRAMGMIPVEDMHTSHNISTSDNFDGFWVRDGAIGMFANHPFDFRERTVVDGKTWTVSDMEIPFTRMRANIFTNNFAADTTGLISNDSNGIMTAGEEMAVWVRMIIVNRFNNDLPNRANDIVKVRGLTT